MPTNILKKRNEVLESDTWRLEDIFASDQAVLEAIQEAKTWIDKIVTFKGKILSNAETLYHTLKTQDKMALLVSKIYVYSHMRLHQDGGNSFYQDLANRAEALQIEASSKASFMTSELKVLDQKLLSTFESECEDLKLYHRQLSELIRQKDHILDDTSESLLSQFAEITNAPSNIYAMFNNVEIPFPEVQDEKGESFQLTHGRYIQLLESKDRSLREAAFKGMLGTYNNYRNTLSSIFAANIKQFDLISRIRGFNSPLESALDANNIPTSVYTNLIDTVHKHLPLMHEYMGLRKEILGLDTMHMYDLNVPIVTGFEKKISFEEASEIVIEAMAPLGEDYQTLLREAFDNRWVDKYENAGKRSGAYSWGTIGAPHPYVLMNYTDNIKNLFTLAHEMGHALHSYLSHHTQPQPYAHYCIFVAEVASTVNESLLMQHLLKTVTDPVYRHYLITYFIDQFRTTVYRQTMFAEFEKIVHDLNSEGTPLNANLLCEKYYELVSKYHGSALEVDPLIEIEWARIPHFYTPYYVYQYATGFSAAVALSQKILNEGEHAVTAYKNFLSGGSSKDPIDLLKDAGVDMSSPEPITKALAVFEGLIKELRSLSKA